MGEPFVPTGYVPVNNSLYDCRIECDSSTKVIFTGLEQSDVLRLMQLVRDASILEGYSNPKKKKVSLIVEAHEDIDGDNDK